VGLKLVIVGPEALTVNGAVLVAVPLGVVTVIEPVVALAGTVVVIDVALATLKDALAPLNVTELAPIKFVPVIVTFTPAWPLLGENDVILGLCDGAADSNAKASRMPEPESRSSPASMMSMAVLVSRLRTCACVSPGE